MNEKEKIWIITALKALLVYALDDLSPDEIKSKPDDMDQVSWIIQELRSILKNAPY